MTSFLFLKEKFTNKKGFLRNFSLLTISNLLATATNMLINMLLARTLSTENYGQYGVFISISNILLVLSSLGLKQIVLIKIARNQADSLFYLRVATILRSLGFIITIILFYFASISSYFDKDLYIYIITYVLFLSAFESYQYLAFGMQRMEFSGYLNFAGHIFSFVCLLALSKTFSLKTVIAIVIISQIIKVVSYSVIIFKFDLLKSTSNIKIKITDYKELLFSSFPYYVLGILTLFTSQVPLLFLEINSSLTEVAYFNAANKLMLPLALVLSTAMTTLFPNLAQSFASNKNQFTHYIKSALMAFSIIGIICCISINLFREDLILLVYGDKYKGTGLILMSQAWFVFFNTIFGLIGNVLGASDNQRLLLKLSVFYALTNIPILWFSSHYGARHLSYGYLVGALINITYHWFYLNKSLPIKLKNKFSILFFLSLLIGISITFLIPFNYSIIYRLLILILLLFMAFFMLKKTKINLS